MNITPADFDYLKKMLKEQSAIVIEPGKEYLVESRLLPLARSEGFESLEALTARLKSTPLGILHDKVVDAMTTNETFFFRDIHPFDSLKKHVFPELIQKRATEKALNIWCAAASSGQEMYTIAMILREHFPETNTWKIRFLGSDISPTMLKRCEEGVYTQADVNRGLPAPYLVKYFEKQGANWQVKSELRKMLELKNINLMNTWPLLPSMDLIFMRNVLIYFDVETKKSILGKVRGTLKKDGYLFLGGAETTLNLDDNFERVTFDKAACYRIKP